MIDNFSNRYLSCFCRKKTGIYHTNTASVLVQNQGKNTHMKPQGYSLYRMITCIWQLNNPLETQPTYVGCTARTCKLYSPRMQTVRHTYVGYKLIAIKVGLLSTGRIYTDSLQQKQTILRLSDLYSTILLMRDTLFLVV